MVHKRTVTPWSRCGDGDNNLRNGGDGRDDNIRDGDDGGDNSLNDGGGRDNSLRDRSSGRDDSLRDGGDGGGGLENRCWSDLDGRRRSIGARSEVGNDTLAALGDPIENRCAVD